ncbi:MAG: DUF1275 domain-containing protein [Lactobacillaceae bacterium]|jgi:uncharacterized membrane protein YoaK (UPF0700 family)|nr:DUF1275 domain-containing protein [Lactobacillaceae bacterium]
MAVQQKIMKESLRVGILLTATAGFVDSYTFAFHDARFASFQSGNLLQFGVNLAAGNFSKAMIFFWPITFFMIGAGLNQLVKRYRFINDIQWEELSVLIEAFGVAIVAILEVLHFPAEVNLSILAMFMSIQADTFSKLRGAPYATIMSTGNLKTLGAMLASFLISHDKASLKKARNIFIVILGFIGGAIVAHFIGMAVHGWAMFVPVGLLLLIWWNIRADRLIEA